MNVKCIPTGPFDVNTYVVYDDGPAAFVVDPACSEYCNDQSAVVNFLKKNNLTCCAIVLTHGHFDHVAGINYLKNVFSFAPILISRNDSAYIGKDSAVKQNELLEPMTFTHFLPYVSGLCEPDAFADVAQAIKDAGLDPKFVAIRGGTDGARLSFMGLPCPNLGTGGYAFHGPYEHITAEAMDKMVEILINIAKQKYK